MTDNIGPHGKGCECPPQEHEPTMKCFSFHRGDLSGPHRQVYEFVFGDSDRKKAPGRILVELDTHNPRVVDAMAFMRESFNQVFGDAIAAHTRKLMQEIGEDPISTLLKELFGDRMMVFEVPDGPAPERENEQDVNS